MVESSDESFVNRYISFSALGLGIILLLIEAVSLGLYHEEPTRILVAVSMLTRGEWLVPNLLGHLYLKKPPGFNWLIALVSMPFGEVSAFSARLSAIFSWLAMGGLAGWFGGFIEKKRSFSWIAALATWFNLTIFIEKAAFAEIDLYFSLLLFASLVTFYVLRLKKYFLASWVGSHGLLALALLTKGPVAYLFFYLPLLVFILWEAETFRWKPFVVGFLIAHLIAGGWLWILISRISVSSFISLVAGEMFNRGNSGNLVAYLVGLMKYPVLLFGAFLPWSPILFGFTYRDWREKVIDKNGSLVRFAVSALSPVLILWLLPMNKVRYALPVFPWLALLVAVLVLRLRNATGFRNFVRKNVIFLSSLILIAGLTPLEFDPNQLITGTTQLIAGGILITLGSVCFVRSIRASQSLVSLLTLHLLVLLLLKAGYLGLYLPSEEPQIFLDEPAIRKTAQSLREQGFETVRYELNNHLEVPFYFHKEGFGVTIDPNGIKERKAELRIIDSPEGTGQKLDVLSLHAGSDLFIYGTINRY